MRGGWRGDDGGGWGGGGGMGGGGGGGIEGRWGGVVYEKCTEIKFWYANGIKMVRQLYENQVLVRKWYENQGLVRKLYQLCTKPSYGTKSVRKLYVNR